ncbi:MAG TPA: hypothetical protein VNM48_15930 [Chloroflexota bacterium]|nr:hypothetical protein [Chloroflexota bacterium]
MIRAGGYGTLLAHIFLRTGVTADVIWAKPPGVRTFCFEAMKWALGEAPTRSESGGE